MSCVEHATIDDVRLISALVVGPKTGLNISLFVISIKSRLTFFWSDNKELCSLLLKFSSCDATVQNEEEIDKQELV